MHGTTILARTLTRQAFLDKQFNNVWQYHSRSDRHSKVACWGILFDLLLTSRVLSEHFQTARVAFGINHEMRDFRTGRRKNLDLVVCTPGTARSQSRRQVDLTGLAKSYGVVLDDAETELLAQMPPVIQADVGEVHIALEAKACMTAHRKARPRLYDELSSSHQTIHGSAANAIAAGFVMVNLSDAFISTDRNRWSLRDHPPAVTKHKQPDDAVSVIDKIREIPRRGTTNESGFDALGVVVVKCRNDGSPFEIVNAKPAVDVGDVLHYESMIRRAAKLYESRFPQA
ncbi:MAG: hypothetical protein KF830_17190 [Planctomycetes bacterium]|nr:hypothetical protein [Planctomycetota bacterium]